MGRTEFLFVLVLRWYRTAANSSPEVTIHDTVKTPIETPTAVFLLSAFHLGLVIILAAKVHPSLLSNIMKNGRVLLLRETRHRVCFIIIVKLLCFFVFSLSETKKKHRNKLTLALKMLYPVQHF